MGSTQLAHTLLQSARVAPEIFQLRPDYRALLMVVEGIPPGPSDEASEAFLQEAEATVKELLSKSAVTELSHISPRGGRRIRLSEPSPRKHATVSRH